MKHPLVLILGIPAWVIAVAFGMHPRAALFLCIVVALGAYGVYWCLATPIGFLLDRFSDQRTDSELGPKDPVLDAIVAAVGWPLRSDYPSDVSGRSAYEAEEQQRFRQRFEGCEKIPIAQRSVRMRYFMRVWKRQYRPTPIIDWLRNVLP